jgi:hypothetical protein
MVSGVVGLKKGKLNRGNTKNDQAGKHLVSRGLGRQKGWEKSTYQLR